MSPSIRVSLREDEAEALLWTKGAANPKPDPLVLLDARSKLITALLARREYLPPHLRPKVRA